MSTIWEVIDKVEVQPGKVFTLWQEEFEGDRILTFNGRNGGIQLEFTFSEDDINLIKNLLNNVKE